jgi:GNAT superfamily N-acetyltransferase
MALWDIYLTPSKWRRSELSWLSGQERERADALIKPLWDAREKFWLDEKYLYCHVLAVHPEYQRRGIGKLLMQFGIDCPFMLRAHGRVSAYTRRWDVGESKCSWVSGMTDQSQKRP